MANGKELKEYRQKILSKILNHNELCELILNRKINNIDDELIQSELTEKHIFRFAFVPDIQDDESIYVTFELKGRMSGSNDLYKNMSLIFYIFCHHNLLKHQSGFLRTDLIDEKIQSIFNNNCDFGIGKMTCVSDDYLRANNTHYGRQLEFRVKEMNSTHCGVK